MGLNHPSIRSFSNSGQDHYHCIVKSLVLGCDKSKSGARDKTFRIKSIDLHFADYAISLDMSCKWLFILAKSSSSAVTRNIRYVLLMDCILLLFLSSIHNITVLLPSPVQSLSISRGSYTYLPRHCLRYNSV